MCITQIINECVREKKTTLNLRGMDIRTLPESIGSCSTLETLDLGNNPLTELPEAAGRLSRLKSLFLDGTSIVRLPESMLQIPLLRKVVVYDNIIFPFRNVQVSLKETGDRPRKIQGERGDENKPPSPGPLTGDAVGDMLGMLSGMVSAAGPGPVSPGEPAPVETVSVPDVPGKEFPRAMLLGDRLIGFKVLPHKTNSGGYDSLGFCIILIGAMDDAVLRLLLGDFFKFPR
jgi:Leucine-rich repeat (LRR) protein